MITIAEAKEEILNIIKNESSDKKEKKRQQEKVVFLNSVVLLLESKTTESYLKKHWKLWKKELNEFTKFQKKSVKDALFRILKNI